MGNVYYKESIPLNNFGANGDIVVANIKGSGAFIFSKIANRWWTSGKLVESTNSTIYASDASAIHIDKSNEITNATLKGSPENDDVVLVEDSSDSYSKKRSTISSLRTAMFQKNIFQIPCLADAWSLTVSTGLGFLIVPEELDQWYFVNCQAHVATPSSSGDVKFNIYNVDTSSFMYNTAAVPTIDATEYDTATSSVSPVIDSTTDQVTKGQKLRIDCTQAGTGTKGLIMLITFNKER